VGIEVAGCIVVGLLAGWYLDKRFDTDPILMIVFFAAGVTAAGRALWRVVKKEIRDGENKDE
jgi:ATP synthase protein I